MAHRQKALDWLRTEPGVSVLIVGGGINGAGLFRELALQGVEVVLVEKADFCSGASCASSRMIHGGLRYLEYGEFRLVCESLKERNLLLQNAAHYVRPLPTTIPVLAWLSGVGTCVGRFLGVSLRRPAHRGAAMVKAGLTLYDVFTRANQVLPRHRFTGRAKALARRPGLTPDIVCTATYYDAWISYPERLCVELFLDGEAASDRARALNYVSLQSGQGAEVQLRDELTGESFVVRPQVLVNAAGAWIDSTNAALGRNNRMIGGTKGAHLVLEHDALFGALDGEMIYFENADGRVVIVFPWLGKVLLGTTDLRIDAPDEAVCTEEEIDYMFDAIRQVFPGIEVHRGQIASVFSGVRPLPYGDAGATGQISRDHSCPITEPADAGEYPVYSMIGGKWTTFRGFSAEVADLVLKRLGTRRRVGSEHLAIGGGRDFPRTRAARTAWLSETAARTGRRTERLESLLDRYGTRAGEVASLSAGREDPPLRNHPDYTRGEIEFILRHERVERLDDLVARRLPLALRGELTRALLEELADIMAGVQGWEESRAREEAAHTAALLERRNRIRLS